MQPVALCGRLLHQITMPACEGVGVHHNAADFVAVPTQCGEVACVLLKAGGIVFHQHHNARHLRQGIKATLFKQRFILAFGIDK